MSGIVGVLAMIVSMPLDEPTRMPRMARSAIRSCAGRWTSLTPALRTPRCRGSYQHSARGDLVHAPGGDARRDALGGPPLLHARLGRLPPPLGGHEHARSRSAPARRSSIRSSRPSRPASSSRRGVAPDVYYEAVIIIIALILTGNAFEARAKTQTSAALRALVDLQPKTARVVRGDGSESGRAGRAGARRRRRSSCGPASGSRWTARSSPARARWTSRCSPASRSRWRSSRATA